MLADIAAAGLALLDSRLRRVEPLLKRTDLRRFCVDVLAKSAFLLVKLVDRFRLVQQKRFSFCVELRAFFVVQLLGLGVVLRLF